MAKKFTFRTIEKEFHLVVLKFDGDQLSVWRVYEVDGTWTAPLYEIAKECIEHLQMEIVKGIGMPVMAKADWYEKELFVFTRSDGQEIDLERLTDVYKKTFGVE